MIILVLLLQLFVSSTSLFIPHASGDQRAYVALAMKLDAEGFSGYNLRHVGLRFNDGFVEYFHQNQEPGDLLSLMSREGTPSYDQPIFYAPPAFTALITLSHRLLANGKPFAVLTPKGFQTPNVSTRAPSVQLYACLIPILGGLLVAFATYLIGKSFFSRQTGLLASFLVVLSPVQMLASQRIWADTILAGFCTFAFFFFYRWSESNRWRDFVWAVIFFSFAQLTKSTAVLLALPLCYLFVWKRFRDGRILGNFLFLILFFSLCFILTLPWYAAVTRMLGGPFNIITAEGVPLNHPWFEFLRNRPWYTLSAGVIYQVPIYILGFAAACLYAAGLIFVLTPQPKRKGALPLSFSQAPSTVIVQVNRAKENRSTISRLRRFITAETFGADTFLKAHVLSVWFLVFLIMLTAIAVYPSGLPQGPEHRYLLPAYPPIALLTAFFIFKFIDWFRAKGILIIGFAGLLVLLSTSVCGSILIFRQSFQLDLVATPF